MTRPRVVAIDGAAGSGKSTLARALARRLSLPYINTGLMYRALAAAAIRAGVSPDDEARLVELDQGLRFMLGGSPVPELVVQGHDSGELSTPEVERIVSRVARHPRIRSRMREAQRELGREGAVMEGRDIGSVVFPDAPVKLFLSATPTARADRRVAERPQATAADLAARDEHDDRTNRLAPQADAVSLDTVALDIDHTLEAAIDVVRRLAPELLP